MAPGHSSSQYHPRRKQISERVEGGHEIVVRVDHGKFARAQGPQTMSLRFLPAPDAVISALSCYTLRSAYKRTCCKNAEDVTYMILTAMDNEVPCITYEH